MNNSQNYNQGMSFFGNYVTPEKEQDANAEHQVQILFILYFFLNNKKFIKFTIYI